MRYWISRVMLSCALFCLGGNEALAQNQSYGIVSIIFNSPHANAVSGLGTGSVRLGFDWFRIEPQQDQFDWAVTDAWVADATARGLSIYATMAYTPQWAGPAWSGECVDGHCAPHNMDDWYDFVWHVIDRYRGYSNIVYGVWNEPNLHFLNDNSLATVYGALFVTAHRARMAANPSAALGGPETSHHAMDNGYFQQAMHWISRVWQPQDIITVHWYPDGPFFPTYMDRVRDSSGGHEVWLTETGEFATNDAAQIGRYRYMLEEFLRRGRTWWTKTFFYVLHNGMNGTENIIRSDWTPRATYHYYRDFVTNNP